MRALPSAFRRASAVLAPVVARPVCQPGPVRMTGAVLAPGKRPVTALLRRLGRRAASHVPPSHRVLPRAVWAPLTARQRLRQRCGAGGIPAGGVVCGLEETIARRWGAQRTAPGRSRAPVRASHAPGGTARGLRWRACRLLGPRSGAARVGALPGLPGLGPAARFAAHRGRRQPPWTARAWQRLRRVVRGWPGRESVWGAASSGAALALLATGQTVPRARLRPRLRLEAALSEPAPHRTPGTTGSPRLTGKRRAPLEAMVPEPQTAWPPWRVEPWYGEGPRPVAVAPDTAVWSHTGHSPVARRWGLRRAPTTDCKPQAWFSTHLAPTPAQRLTW